GLLDAIVQKNERRPKLHPERPPERLTAPILDAQMPQPGMCLHHRSDMRLRRPAMRTPRCAELQQREARERVHVLPGGLSSAIHAVRSMSAAMLVGYRMPRQDRND